MNIKILNSIIPLASVVIFFIWGWIEGTYQHSWIIFMIGGGLMGILATINKSKEQDTAKKEESDGK